MSMQRAPQTARSPLAFVPLAALLLAACATPPAKVPPMSGPYPPKRVETPDASDARPASGNDKAVP